MSCKVIKRTTPDRLNILFLLPIFLILILIGGCAKASTQVVPHASIKIIVSSGRNQDQVFSEIDKSIASLGYSNQANKSHFRSFTRGNFEIMYDPADKAQSALNVIYIHFYEQDNSIFSASGIAEYESIL